MSHLHGCAHCKWQLTEWRLQDVDKCHGDKHFLCVQDVPVIERYVDSEHGKGNLDLKKALNVTFTASNVYDG